MSLSAILLATMFAAAPEQIAVVQSTIPRGGSVDLSNVELVSKTSRKLPRMARPYVWNSNERLRARRNLRAGAIIARWDVEPMPDIAAGDPVIVELVRGAVRVTASAVAKEDGFAGEAIWVENPKSKRRLRVRVVEPGRTELRTMWRRQ